jgi:hypothetical protein
MPPHIGGKADRIAANISDIASIVSPEGGRMPDPIKRTEKVHIDERDRKATSTVQWFLENRSRTHPINHDRERKQARVNIQNFNLVQKSDSGAMTGFLLPLEDKRSSTVRLG